MIATSDEAVTPLISGLAVRTQYKVYVVAYDSTDNTASNVLFVAFTTLSGCGSGDGGGALTLSAVSWTSTSTDGCVCSATGNAVRKIYYHVLSKADNVPDAAAIVDTKVDVIKPDEAITPLVSGLAAGTQYKVYVVAYDSTDNTVSNVLFCGVHDIVWKRLQNHRLHAVRYQPDHWIRVQMLRLFKHQRVRRQKVLLRWSVRTHR